MITHPIITHILLHNGKPRILLYNIKNIQKNPPRPATSKSIDGMHLEIIPITSGYSTVNMVKSSGKISKPVRSKLDVSCEYEYVLYKINVSLPFFK